MRATNGVERRREQMLKLWAVQHNMSPPPQKKSDVNRLPMGRLPSDKKNDVKKDPIDNEPIDTPKPIEYWLEKYPIDTQERAAAATTTSK